MLLKEALLEIYGQLFTRYGPQHWWPAEEPFEVIVGAILTQSAAWVNVEKAINQLKEAGALSIKGLSRLSLDELASMIYPSGYYNAKAQKLKTFTLWVEENYHGHLAEIFELEISALRQQLLSIKGIGEETADSIILYAAGKPIFVVDAYSRRIFQRLGLVADNSYAKVQTFFMQNLPLDTCLFNEYHALLVCHGKTMCRKLPLCHSCCLKKTCLTAMSG